MHLLPQGCVKAPCGMEPRSDFTRQRQRWPHKQAFGRKGVKAPGKHSEEPSREELFVKLSGSWQPKPLGSAEGNEEEAGFLATA